MSSIPVGSTRRSASNARSRSPNASNARLVNAPSATVIFLPGRSFAAATRFASRRESSTVVPLAVTSRLERTAPRRRREAQGGLRIAEGVAEITLLHSHTCAQGVRERIIRVRANARVHQRARGSVASAEVLQLTQGAQRRGTVGLERQCAPQVLFCCCIPAEPHQRHAIRLVRVGAVRVRRHCPLVGGYTPIVRRWVPVPKEYGPCGPRLGGMAVVLERGVGHRHSASICSPIERSSIVRRARWHSARAPTARAARNCGAAISSDRALMRATRRVGRRGAVHGQEVVAAEGDLIRLRGHASERRRHARLRQLGHRGGNRLLDLPERRARVREHALPSRGDLARLKDPNSDVDSIALRNDVADDGVLVTEGG